MKIGKIKERLENLGYDSMMLFVNTSLDVALQRNEKRDRSFNKKRRYGKRYVETGTRQYYEISTNVSQTSYVVDNSGGLEDLQIDKRTLLK